MKTQKVVRSRWDTDEKLTTALKEGWTVAFATPFSDGKYIEYIVEKDIGEPEENPKVEICNVCLCSACKFKSGNRCQKRTNMIYPCEYCKFNGNVAYCKFYERKEDAPTQTAIFDFHILDCYIREGISSIEETKKDIQRIRDGGDKVFILPDRYGDSERIEYIKQCLEKYEIEVDKIIEG